MSAPRVESPPALVLMRPPEMVMKREGRTETNPSPMVRIVKVWKAVVGSIPF